MLTCHLGNLNSSSRANDSLVHHGRHFGRTVHAMCNVQALVTNGILCMGDDIPEEALTSEYVDSSVPVLTLPLLYRCRAENHVFQRLLGMVPHLADRLMECSEEEVMGMADLVGALFI